MGASRRCSARSAAKPTLKVVGPAFDASLAFIGLTGVAVGFWALNGRMPWPGFLTLIPVLSATALIATSGTLIHRRILSARPMVFIGLISYPLYLWHFPLIAFAKLNAGGAVSAPAMCQLLPSASCLQG